jgi:hypothetical protein
VGEQKALTPAEMEEGKLGACSILLPVMCARKQTHIPCKHFAIAAASPDNDCVVLVLQVAGSYCSRQPPALLVPVSPSAMRSALFQTGSVYPSCLGWV